MKNITSRLLCVLSFLVLSAGFAIADIAPRPERGSRPDQPAPAPAPGPVPTSKVCGTGMSVLLLGIGVVGAWRLSKSRSLRPLAPRSDL
jgi:hypothetical protein